jgi:hypothetical protein
MSEKIKRFDEGYQPLRKGYQATQTPKNPKPPRGGTGLASRSSIAKFRGVKKSNK